MLKVLIGISDFLLIDGDKTEFHHLGIEAIECTVLIFIKSGKNDGNEFTDYFAKWGKYDFVFDYWKKICSNLTQQVVRVLYGIMKKNFIKNPTHAIKRENSDFYLNLIEISKNKEIIKLITLKDPQIICNWYEFITIFERRKDSDFFKNEAYHEDYVKLLIKCFKILSEGYINIEAYNAEEYEIEHEIISSPNNYDCDPLFAKALNDYIENEKKNNFGFQPIGNFVLLFFGSFINDETDLDRCEFINNFPCSYSYEQLCLIFKSIRSYSLKYNDPKEIEKNLEILNSLLMSNIHFIKNIIFLLISIIKALV